MTSKELIIIKQAQHYCRNLKARKETIACPFVFVLDIFSTYETFQETCMLCHQWSRTQYEKEVHPCNLLEVSVVRQRFWRKPMLD